MTKKEDYNLKDVALKTIEKNNLIEENDSIVVAVSGGPDSISLLHILLSIKEKYKLSLYVAHINHMIRKSAKEDEEYVREFCKNNNIGFYSKSIDILSEAKKKKVGTEEAGRIARYDFFEKIKKETKSNKIAIAHNKNDRVETIILNILRGSGANGLIGIDYKNGYYIRPLLDCERSLIEEYCETEKLYPRIDETNKENIYTRNKVRNIVIPYIKEEFNPNIINTITRLSDIMKENNEYIKNQVEKTYSSILLEEDENYIKINLKKFNQEDLFIRKSIVLYSINKLVGTINGIEKINVEDIIKLAENNIGNKHLKPNKKIKIEMKEKQLYFIKL